MTQCATAYTVQERILHDQSKGSANPYRATHPRLFRLFDAFDGTTPVVDVERARWFTESMRETAGYPLVLRWAMALMNIAKKITVYVDDDQLIVGRCGSDRGRYGILYPELEGDVIARSLPSLLDEGRESCPLVIDPEDVRIYMEEVAPYWQNDRCFREDYVHHLPPEIREVGYRDKDGYIPRFVCNDTCTYRTSLQWVPDYGKVIRLGLKHMKEDALRRLDALDHFSPTDTLRCRPFLEAMVMVCDAIVLWAGRHAELARAKASAEADPGRREELLCIADICERVPEYPARTFHEAMQAQWFISCFSRLEQRTGSIVSNGRMDQYLYPLYRKDMDEGRLTESRALELFDCLWCNLAQYVDVSLSAAGLASYDGYAHWEAVTIGGQTQEGQDAANDLTYLLLESRKSSPMPYPDLAVRIHARSPERLLLEVAETMKVGQGYPKLFNDEEIIPLLMAKGVPCRDANDYAASGCTEVRCPNVGAFTAASHQINLCAVLDLTLHNGRMASSGDLLLGLETGDPREWPDWETFLQKFLMQLGHITRYTFAAVPVIRKIRARHFAAPLLDLLHEKAYDDCRDIHGEEKIDKAVYLAFFDTIGFATMVDSLAAVKYAVYDEKFVTMDKLLEALDADFSKEGMEILRRRLEKCPTFGNNDPYADSIGLAVERYMQEYSDKYAPELGLQMDLRTSSVTANLPHGKEVGALPNGRHAGTPVSDGASPCHHADHCGPTMALLSNYATKAWEYPHRAARLLNSKFTPKCVEGEEGSLRLVDFIRTWRDLRLWHMQVNIINRETLEAAQKDPDSYRNLVVRVAGYSAYFTELSPTLQNDIIERTAYESV